MTGAKKNGLSYEEFIDLAEKHLHDGGADVLECWDWNSFDAYTEMFGPMSKKGAMNIFRSYKSEDDEWEAISTACASGTW